MAETRSQRAAKPAPISQEQENDTTSQPTLKRARRPKSSIDNRPDEVANSPVDYWIQEGHWPRGYLKADTEHALAHSASSATPSDQRPREEKSAPHRDSRYETFLATKGVFMGKSKSNVTTESKTLCKSLLETHQAVPENSLFHDDRFESTCQKIHNRKEARVIQDISRLIVPSAESLATMGATHLEDLVESPDYSVGFQREAFTNEQHDKLSPFIGEFLGSDLSFFMATYYMYFPFLACEVKCGAAALDIADRQNTHSMTLAARGIVELFRVVKREENIYDTWVPEHFKRICSAIDELPSELNFDVPALSESTGLSQHLESLGRSEVDSASVFAEEDNQSLEAGEMESTATSSSKQAPPSKRRRSPVKKA
ncbi:hypothetical protein G7054_g12825 [Neopestalotiopsis clavispora]|nr:hypothetical protein G7054_g12825 [Neopestalotiopsis clavispora]